MTVDEFNERALLQLQIADLQRRIAEALDAGGVMWLKQVANDLESGSYPHLSLTEPQRDEMVEFLRWQMDIIKEFHV